MLIALNGFCHNYEIEQLTRMFTKDTEVTSCTKHPPTQMGGFLYVRQNRTKVFMARCYNNVVYKAFLKIDGDKGK
ncbi:MAG: hypothetical protein RSA20_05085, partial [Oscillospiraceae bacterium]